MRIAKLTSLLTLALAVMVASPSAVGRAGEHPVLGSGHGVDHATLLTRSLVRTSRAFADLGFTVWPVDSSDNGFENSTIYFADGTYLELFGVHDATKVANSSEAHAANGPEGLTWVTVDTSSVDDTVRHLKTKGHKLFGPDALPEPNAWAYKLAGLQSDTLPGHRIYFIEYNDDRRSVRRQAKLQTWQRRESHQNSAQGLQAVWVAVRSLPEAEKLYTASGFKLGRRFDLPHLQSVGREVQTADRAIILIEPAAASPASRLLTARNTAFAGYSVRVQDLAKAKSALAEGGLADLTEHSGPYGKSLLVQPDRAGGSWLELFE